MLLKLIIFSSVALSVNPVHKKKWERGDYIEAKYGIPPSDYYRMNYALPPENVFRVKLNCSVPAPCNKFSAALRRVSLEIAKMILIKRQLLVMVQVDSSKMLGERTSVVVPGFNFIGEMDGGQLLQYSNAAIKQMANDSFLDATKLTQKLDMILGFNQDKQWYFGDGEIAANELDFELAAAQAITRGLGWHSSLKIHKTEQNATYIAPDEVKLDGKLQYFAPITAFDSLIQSENSRRLSDLGSQISTSSLYTGTEKATIASREIAQMLGKDDELYIHWHLENPVNMIARIEGVRYSFYFDEKLANRPDFLMATTLTEGISLKSIMKKQELHSIYGIYTLRVLEGIGFSTVLSPLYPEINISGTFRTRDYNPGIAVERFNFKFLTYPTIKRDNIPRGTN